MFSKMKSFDWVVKFSFSSYFIVFGLVGPGSSFFSRFSAQIIEKYGTKENSDSELFTQTPKM